MQVDQDTFVIWAEQHFDDVKIAGDEVKLPDIWHDNEDHDNKCWVNTYKACFRAFKSERTGHLLALVMDVEDCSWQDAAEMMGLEDSFLGLDVKLDEFLRGEEDEDIQVSPAKTIQLPTNTFLISSLETCQLRKWAEKYLADRKLPMDGLMICTAGPYKDRIVIPYYGPNGDLIYFNTRSLSDQEKLRYKGPAKEEFDVGKGDVLWMSTWPDKGARVYLTEGEFDAMSLAQCGYNAGAVGGKALSDKQKEMLKPYRVTVAFDSDKAGRDAYRIADELLSQRFSEIGIVRPPQGVKDWNKLLVQHGAEIVRKCIEQFHSYYNPRKKLDWEWDDVKK